MTNGRDLAQPQSTDMISYVSEEPPRLVEPPTRAISVQWSDRDAHRWVTIGAPVGLAIGAALAIFGLPPVDLHAPPHYVGIMDPFCGMTRGVVALLRGNLADALGYNPASPLVVLAGLGGIARGLAGTLGNRWLTLRARRTRLLVVAVGVAVVALEIRQQINVDLLTS